MEYQWLAGDCNYPRLLCGGGGSKGPSLQKVSHCKIKIIKMCEYMTGSEGVEAVNVLDKILVLAKWQVKSGVGAVVDEVNLHIISLIHRSLWIT